MDAIEIKIKGTETDKDVDESANGEEITYVAISPDGSIVAKFNPFVMKSQKKIFKSYPLVLLCVSPNEETNTFFDRKCFHDGDEPLGWSLAVSDIIDNDTGLVAISYIIDEDMNLKGIEQVNKFQILLDITKQLLQNFVKLLIPYCLIIFFLIFIVFLSLPIFLSVFLLCLFVLLNLYYFFRLCASYYATSEDDIEQFRLSLIPSKGTIKLIKFSFKNNSHYDDNDNNKSTYHRGGGVVSFLKNSKNSSKNSATLICMNCTKIRKINIKITYENISASEGGAYLLPENLFNELENIKDGSCKLKYLLKSRWQEFLIIKTKDYQDYQHKQCIGLYNINTLQLVNIFSVCSVCSMSKNELGIFAISTGSKSTGSISTDSRLFAYSYGDNTITIYLMESGLEVVQKRFNDINKIKFLEFNKEDKELIIIEDKNGDMKFHIWVLSGCLNDHLVIEHNTSILSNYDYDHCLAKANGVVVFIDNENNIESLHNSSSSIIKSVESDLKDFDEDFSKTFERFRDLCFRIDYEDKPEFDKDMATNIKIACRFLAYLYDDNDGIDRGKSIDSNHQELVNETIKFIKSFIKYFPNHWKLMEHNKEDGYLHRPQNKYVTYPYYDLDLKLRDEDLKSANDLELTLKCRQGRDAVMLAYLLEYYSRNFMECSHIGWMINVTKILPKLSADYMESLYYLYFNKSHFGKMKYNFPIRRDEELPNIYIVPNFTTYGEKIEGKFGGKFGTILYWLRKILLPPGYKNLDYKGHKSFLYIESVIVFTLIFVKSFNEVNEINNERIVILLAVTTLILWIEMLLWLRLFTEVAVYIYIFGNILKKIIPFFVFMIILTIGFGHSMFVLFGHPSLLDLNPSASTFTLDNGTNNFTLTGEIPENPFNTIWDAILSAYYWNAIDLSGYNYWPLKLLAFIANVILVLVLLNMIIALMNDAFNKAKEDGNLGLVTFRAELIDEYERLDNSFFRKLLHSNSPYICFHQNHDITEKWIKKTKKNLKT
ncbi:hypothetical protein GLOIN_2v1484628 [Rhizophagus irregularis DAOM 181602=DAOM 197198]|uniref:Ion transport domain-containing protein n=2 Tax=Rhizophagus irregularis (strain DAOM 181602 / DAOM 197198 / MUCL 43194) TaxID=747089 RepID=A0A2P4PDQ9_RHIID|nr:hypothetical protein GLOIN_2v1484628 [Rhizophagus irregularis DAOM 181602=DAOM 197198]POG63515.1 hypothetical protein GLOIN_2v1484628 [Rhizophagus irregularis DAOM 181602=DAOM 197198]|eukprot:XP_025170381.1 hypothetical protein GLOIN_2v1484628 [Rhizophagus irregularis DAOM 181602=DAOM 197198]